MPFTPCPFCSRVPLMNHDYADARAKYRTYWVSCEECGFSLPNDNTEAEALARWNTRGAPTPTRDSSMVENQHKRISGYRDLTEDEIAAKNHIAAAEEEIAALWRRTRAAATQAILTRPAVPGEQLPDTPHELHEAMRQIALARTHFEQGFMHLSRGVLRPRNVWDGRNVHNDPTSTGENA